MGTSKSLATPTGGGWSDTKSQVTGKLTGSRNVTPSRIAGSIVRAGRGVGVGGTPGGIGSVVGGIGGFGAAVAESGLNEALAILGLRDLEGLSAVEVATAIADGLENLESGLESFLQEEGVLGLIALVLEKFVFNAIWACIEDHAQLKAPTREEFEALLIAIQGVCESEVQSTISDLEERGEIESVDWFGPEGARLGGLIFGRVEQSLRIEGHH